MWRVKCDDRDLRLNGQIANVLARLQPYRDKIVVLKEELRVEQPVGTLRLGVVRYYDDDEGEEESERETVDPDGTVWERLPGQHQLLGWGLDSEALTFLHDVGAVLDVDEYG